jgi:hypothetical protein
MFGPPSTSQTPASQQSLPHAAPVLHPRRQWVAWHVSPPGAQAPAPQTIDASGAMAVTPPAQSPPAQTTLHPTLASHVTGSLQFIVPVRALHAMLHAPASQLTRPFRHESFPLHVTEQLVPAQSTPSQV